MQGYPTYNEIINDYNEVYELIKNIDTIKKLKTVDWTETEINGYPLKEMENISMDEVSWFRYENYKNLDYIYVNFENGKIDYIYFDVWCSKHDVDFIECMSINELTYEEYCKAIVELENHMEYLKEIR